MATRTPNGFLVFVGSLAAVSIVALIFVWTIASGPRPGDLDQKRAAERIATREKLDQEDAAALSTEAWVDKAKGIVRVPVATAMSAVAKELAAKKPAPSQVKVDAPLPVAPVDPKATEPAPPALPSAPQGADTVTFAALSTPAPAPAQPAAPAPAAAPQTPPAPVPAPANPAPKPAPTTPAAAPAPAPAAPPAAAAPAPARPPIINSPEQK